MRFDELVDGVVEDGNLRATIANLLARKRAGDELARGPRDAVLGAYIDAELALLGDPEPPDDPVPDAEALNRFFQNHCLRSPALALACSG
jgi:predicted nucleotidyltransferase